MKKILYMTNLPVPYKIDFFNELGRNMNLTVVFERRTASDREDSWLSSSFLNFNAVFMDGKEYGNEAAFCPEICSIIKKGKYDEIVVGAYYTLTGMLAIQYMKTHKISYYISSDGGFIKNEKKIKKYIKQYFIQGAKGYFSPSKITDKYLIYYGANEKKIYRYPFTSLKNSDLIMKTLNNSEKQILKKKLKIAEEKIILGVGQFIPRKGWNTLMEASLNLSKKNGIYIIGGKATEEYILLKKKMNLNNVHFIDFKNKDTLKEYYHVADVFVLPTREDIWGLVINEALAYGLPVITTDKCMAGLEMIENGKNGYIIPVNDVKKLSEKLTFILSEKDFYEEMRKGCLKTAEAYTIEKMSEAYEKILQRYECSET